MSFEEKVNSENILKLLNLFFNLDSRFFDFGVYVFEFGAQFVFRREKILEKIFPILLVKNSQQKKFYTGTLKEKN